MKKKIPKPKVQKWPRSDLILFLEKMELYSSSGLPIDAGLRIAAENVGKKQVAVLKAICKDVESGTPISAAISRNVRIPKTVCSLIDQGESSAELHIAFQSARILLEKEDELLKKCLSAMAYPIVIGVFALGLTLGLMRGVMPQIIPLLISLHEDLPLITRIVISISNGLVTYGIYSAIALVIITALFCLAYSKLAAVRRFIHGLIWRTPIVGKLANDYALSVFLRSCGSLIRSGTPIHTAYERTVAGISFLPVRSLLEERVHDIAAGIPLVKAFGSNKRIPPHVSGLVAAGESSGTLGASMIRAADIIDRSMDHSLKRLTSLIEPVMMAGMGCMVGSIAVSIMMPIYGISKALQQ